MSIPSFVPQPLAESAQTTVQNVIRVVNNIQNQLQTILAYFTKSVQLNSTLLQNIAVTSGLNQIPHTLGRTLTGWQVIGISASATFYDQQASNPNPSVYLYLIASAPATISLLVF